jgi:hypothetical protein
VKDWKFERYVGIPYKGREQVNRLREWIEKAWPEAPKHTPGGLSEQIAKMLPPSDPDPEQPE